MRTLALSLLPLPLSVFSRRHSQKSHLFCPLNSTITRVPNKPITRVLCVNPNPRESESNGGVDDMEGYLNNLSLEYDSVWDTKPSWCQPWTITLTGVSIIGISWLVLHSLLVTSIISLPIAAWWYIFLYSYPKAYSEMIAERREKVTNGVEDTFGRRKRQ